MCPDAVMSQVNALALVLRVQPGASLATPNSHLSACVPETLRVRLNCIQIHEEFGEECDFPPPPSILPEGSLGEVPD
jgi:hypothetical protein|eukprot:COSAG02_NODE_723_length_18041_cov_7.464720_8_plen_77_part_00